MLMDAFFAVAVTRRKRRAHFHEFMADVHERVHAARQATGNGGQKASDPIAAVAVQIAAETRLLCLDEFMVTDITDAMILSRLFVPVVRARPRSGCDLEQPSRRSLQEWA